MTLPPTLEFTRLPSGTLVSHNYRFSAWLYPHGEDEWTYSLQVCGRMVGTHLRRAFLETTELMFDHLRELLREAGLLEEAS